MYITSRAAKFLTDVAFDWTARISSAPNKQIHCERFYTVRLNTSVMRDMSGNTAFIAQRFFFVSTSYSRLTLCDDDRHDNFNRRSF